MSGPKGAGYSVVSVQEQRRREAAASRARIAELQRAISDSLLVVGERGHSLGPAPQMRAATDDPESLRQEEQRATAYLIELQELVREHQQERVVEQLTAALSGFTSTLTLTTSAPPPSHQLPQAPRDFESRLATLARRLVELDEPHRSAMLSDLRVVSDAIKASDSPSGQLAQQVRDLEGRMSQALRSNRAASALEQRRESLRLEFADVPATHQEAWVAVDSATDARTLERSADLLREARAKDDLARDHAFVLAEATAALEELGYHVEASPSHGVDALLAKKPSWPRHGLRLLLPDTQAALTTVPEAYGATDHRDDEAFERESCNDLGSLTQHLLAAGIEMRWLTASAPGTVDLLRHPLAGEEPRYTAPLEREHPL